MAHLPLVSGRDYCGGTFSNGRGDLSKDRLDFCEFNDTKEGMKLRTVTYGAMVVYTTWRQT